MSNVAGGAAGAEVPRDQHDVTGGYDAKPHSSCHSSVRFGKERQSQRLPPIPRASVIGAKSGVAGKPSIGVAGKP